MLPALCLIRPGLTVRLLKPIPIPTIHNGVTALKGKCDKEELARIRGEWDYNAEGCTPFFDTRLLKDSPQIAWGTIFGGYSSVEVG